MQHFISVLINNMDHTSYLECILKYNDALSNGTSVNDLVTLTYTFVLKIGFLNFVAAGA